MKNLIRGFAAGMILLSAVACSNGASSSDARVEEIRSMPAEALLVEIQTKLHTDGLLTIPEVRTKSDELVQSYRTGVMTKEEAGKELLLWLDQWVRENPELAKSARSGAAQDASARALSID